MIEAKNSGFWGDHHPSATCIQENKNDHQKTRALCVSVVERLLSTREALGPTLPPHTRSTEKQRIWTTAPGNFTTHVEARKWGSPRERALAAFGFP